MKAASNNLLLSSPDKIKGLREGTLSSPLITAKPFFWLLLVFICVMAVVAAHNIKSLGEFCRDTNPQKYEIKFEKDNKRKPDAAELLEAKKTWDKFCGKDG